MKKAVIIGVLILVVLGVIISSYAYKKNSLEKELIDVVSPEITNYCFNLPIEEGMDCPTCTENIEYKISKNGDDYSIEAKIDLIYGGQNNQPGEVSLLFLISKEKEILEKTFPEKSCV